MSTFNIKQIVTILLLLALLLLASIAEAKPAKIGALTAIGQDEKAVLAWTENIAEAEGKALSFRNMNTIIFFDDLNSMIMALRAGQIDRFAIGLNTARYITLRNKDFKLIDNKHNAVLGMSIAVREEDRKKLLGINLAINDMWTDGTLERLIRENIIELGAHDPEAVELPKFDDAQTMRIAVTGDLPPMDCILPDGRPAGFNTVFLAELGRRTHINFELVSINSGARQSAISSGRVDALFWTRGVFNNKRQPLPYSLDKVAGVAVSEPYFMENRAAVSLNNEQQ
ncbi:MAG: transporter substrate-binding domain-containing protein [Synergistaceae bacterium]|nr:transporter substrate-binding domain-containing protein [Synergistaceae bacterium]